MPKKRWLISLLAVVLVASATVSLAVAGDNRVFSTHLTGGQVTTPVDTLAQGQATFKVDADGTSLHCKVTVAGIENATAIQLHLGSAGQDGEVVMWLWPRTGVLGLMPGRSSGSAVDRTYGADKLVGPLEGRPLSELIDAMRAGNVYIDVLTTQSPGGEIRGQIQ